MKRRRERQTGMCRNAEIARSFEKGEKPPFAL